MNETNVPAGEKKPQRPFKIFRPMRAIRLNCLACSGDSPKSVLWCGSDGIHSPRCHFWPYRFGYRPETVAERYGPALVTPDAMPGANVCEDDLPNGMGAATRYLTQHDGDDQHGGSRR